MPKTQINKRLFPKKTGEWREEGFKPKVLKGSLLQPSAAIEEWFQREILRMVERMTGEVTRDVTALFHSPAATVLDRKEDNIFAEEAKRKKPLRFTTGSIASQSRIALAGLLGKFSRLFSDRASILAKKMVRETLKASEITLKASLKKATGAAVKSSALKSGLLGEIVKASVQEAVGLIKRIPQDYIGRVQNAVMRSITQPNAPTLQSVLEEEVKKHNIQIRNWAFNTARDQTTKVYTNMTVLRMKAAKIQKFEWIHSGGSSHPRIFHMARHPEGLNGGIFEIDNPPMIQKASGNSPEIRGYPGQLPNCHCKLRPIFDGE
jgi:uncharacterized protein with gpF-like domain